MSDTISRQAAIDALWKALYTYEDETERRFQESDELNVGDWIGHRIFVQNMNDIDRQTILNLPSAQPEQRWIPCSERPAEASCLACDKFGQMFIPTSIVVINDKCFDGTDFDFAKPDEFLKGVNIGHGVRILPREITAWMPLPEPWKEGNNG